MIWNDKTSPQGLRETLLGMPVSTWLESRQDASGWWSVECWDRPRWDGCGPRV